MYYSYQYYISNINGIKYEDTYILSGPTLSSLVEEYHTPIIPNSIRRMMKKAPPQYGFVAYDHNNNVIGGDMTPVLNYYPSSSSIKLEYTMNDDVIIGVDGWDSIYNSISGYLMYDGNGSVINKMDGIASESSIRVRINKNSYDNASYNSLQLVYNGITIVIENYVLFNMEA